MVKEESILASHFIPQQDRLWSDLPPSITLRCRTLLPSPIQQHQQQQQQQEVEKDDDDDGTTTTTANNNNNTIIIPKTWPNSELEFDQEFRYAIEYRKHEMWIIQQEQQQQQIHNNNSNNNMNANRYIPPPPPPPPNQQHYQQQHQQKQQQQQQHLQQQNTRLPSGFVEGTGALSSSSSSILIPTPRSISDVQENDIIDLVQTFQTLVRLERQEILRRYEQYTQYQQCISVTNLMNNNQHHHQHKRKQEDNTNSSNNITLNSNNANNNNRGELFVSACIPGIADSKPSPQRGDWILVRPVCYISMPIMNSISNNNINNSSNNNNANNNEMNYQQQQQRLGMQHHHPNNDNNNIIVGWTPACHIVDILCTITNVTRSTPTTTSASATTTIDGKNKDSITATWLEPEQDDIIRKVYYGSDQPLFQLRIIPNKKEYERCIIALLWLNTINTSERILPLLFPTHAPVLTGSTYNSNHRHQGGAYFNNKNNMSSSFYDNKNSYNQNNDYANPEHLNSQQTSFVNIVLARTYQPSFDEVRPPIILTGPAGTGKTKTLLYAIVQLLKDNNDSNNSDNNNKRSNKHRILICTPSHTAANVITQRLAATFKPNELFRLLDSDRNIATIPISILSYCYQAKNADRFDIPSIDVLMQYRIIVSTCSDAYLLYDIGLTNQQLRQQRVRFRDKVQKESIKLNVQITFDNDSIDGPHFTHFFMDEAAQATEPESMIPLSVVIDPEPNSRKVEIGLVGDPRQLSPMIYSKQAADAGLNHSWMERLLHRPVRCFNNPGADVSNNSNCKNNEGMENDIMRYNRSYDVLGPELIQMDDWLKYSMEQDGQEQLAVFLMLNYRGHPSFLMIPSSLFYSDRLQRAGYTLEEEQENEKQEYEEQNYWCQKLRILESLAVPVTLTPRQQQYHHQQQGQQKQHHNDATVDSIKTGSIASEQIKCVTNGTNNSGNIHEEFFIQYKQWDWPIHFRGVIGKDTNSSVHSTFSTESWCNNEEADVVVEIIVELTSTGRVSTNKIGVMAPFRGQVVLIRKLLRSKNLGGVDVGTIEDYQSMERDVVVLSLTRSSASFINHDDGHRIGMFGPSQAKRCNVALTRAKQLLIVVGNPDVMIHDFLWRQFLWFCFRNVFWYGEAGQKLASFSWSKELQVVKSFDVLQIERTTNRSSFALQYQNGNSNNWMKSSSKLDDKDTNIVVISSLERSLRLC